MKLIAFSKKDEEFNSQNIPGLMQEIVKQAKRLDETADNEFKLNKKRSRGLHQKGETKCSFEPEII